MSVSLLCPRPTHVERHDGTAADFLRRHCASAAELATLSHADLSVTLIRRIADTRTLRLAVEKVRREGGPGPGVDGVRPGDLDHRDWMCLIRELSNEIRKGTYRPDRERLHRVPKASGGFRILSIPTVRDRVVQRAIVEILSPLVEPTMASTTYGGRPGCSTWDALLAAEADVAAGKNVLVVADIRDAFDVLPHAPLRRSLEARWGATPLVDLLMRIAVNGRSLGIGQGGPLSTLLLNIYLTDKLDRPWARLHPETRLIRWIDDQFVSVTDLTAGSRALGDMATLLDAAGMPPKPESATEPAVVNLSDGGSPLWLGYRICRGPEGLEARIDENVWEELRRKLEQAYDYDRPWQRARDLVHGWIAYFGPCVDREANANRVADMLRRLDLEEAIRREQILDGWQRAHRRYCARRPPNEQERPHDAQGAAFAALSN